jgi:hypothetical protein
MERPALVPLVITAHDDDVTTRGGLVSFVKTPGPGAPGKVDIHAVKLP